MRSEYDVTGFDAEVFAEKMIRHGISRKRLAFLLNRNESTVSRYCNGELTIPIDAFRHLYAETLDMEIVRLVTGDAPLIPQIAIGLVVPGRCDEVRDTGAPLRIPPIPELLPRTLTSLEHLTQSLKCIHDAVQDGRIDSADAASIAKARAHIDEAQKNLALVSAALKTGEEAKKC